MNKQKTKKLITNDDYSKMAIKCFNNAEFFYKLCKQNYDNFDIAVPIGANAAFTIELYFKAILYKNCKSFKNHNLLNLFNEVDKEDQDFIYNYFDKNFGMKKELFIRELTYESDTFCKLRYLFENSEPAIYWNALFLYRLLDLLHKYTHVDK